MIDVGIDVGKYSHVVALSPADAKVQLQPEVFSIENTPAGRAGLLARLAGAAPAAAVGGMPWYYCLYCNTPAAG